MRNENGYIGFILFTGGTFLLAGYFVDLLFALLGGLIMSVGIIVSVIMKLQERRQEQSEPSDEYDYPRVTDATATYIR